MSNRIADAEVRLAADLRAASLPWAEVAAKVGRSEGVCRLLVCDSHAAKFHGYLAEATARLAELSADQSARIRQASLEAEEEAVKVLRGGLRTALDTDKATCSAIHVRLHAAEVLLRDAARRAPAVQKHEVTGAEGTPILIRCVVPGAEGDDEPAEPEGEGE